MMIETKPTDTLLGRELEGYHIEALLGEGGMARVYRALDTKLQRYVALKILLTSKHNPNLSVHRFEREARAIAQLKHPHIVGIHRFNIIDNICYIAMEYISGADLRWVLQDYQDCGKWIDYQSVYEIISQIGSALDYAHQHGVIHRDVKPANIMIEQDGKAILTDFNLALLLNEDTAGETFGTAHYISPEQAVNSAQVVSQSDLYSLGVTLYEMLTGDVPFNGDDIIQVASAHIHDLPPDPLERNPRLHPAFAVILKRILAKNPQDRYPSGKVLSEALEKAVHASHGSQSLLRPIAVDSPAERITQRKTPFLDLQKLPLAQPRRTKFNRRKLGLSVLLLCGFILLFKLYESKLPAGAILLDASIPENRFQNAGEVSIPPNYEFAPTSQDLLSLDWSADGQFLAAGASNGDLSIWNAHDGRIVHHGQAHGGEIRRVAWHPSDANILISAAADGTIKIWQIDDTMAEIQSLTTQGTSLTTLAWRADGTSILAGDNNGLISRWDLSNQGSLIASQYSSPLSSVDWSSDGYRFVSGGEDHAVRVWNTRTGMNSLLGVHNHRILAVDWAWNQALAASLSEDGDLRLWQTDTARFRRLAWHLPDARDVHFNHDGSLVAVAHGTAIRLWDVASGRRLAILKLDNAQAIRAFVWGRDDTEIAAVTAEGRLWLWTSLPEAIPLRLTREEVIHGHAGRITAMAWSSLGTRLATADAEGTLALWNTETRQLIFDRASLHTGAISVVAWQNSTNRIITGACDGRILFWDLSTESLVQEYNRPAICLNDLALDLHETQLWEVDNAGRLQIWDLASTNLILQRSALHIAAIEQLISLDSAGFASLGGDSKLNIWHFDGQSLQLHRQLSLNNDNIRAAFWDGTRQQLIFAGDTAQIQLWESPFLTGTNPVFSQTTSPIQALALSYTGDFLATIEANACLSLWQMETAERLFVACEASSPYTRLVWSPTSNLLATGNENGEIQFWHVP